MATDTKKIAKLGVFTLAIMNVTAVVSLRGLPAEAEYGISSAFYYLFAAGMIVPTRPPILAILPTHPIPLSEMNVASQ